MLINYSNVLLQVGFVQNLVCCDLTLKHISRFQVLISRLSELKTAYKEGYMTQAFGSYGFLPGISLHIIGTSINAYEVKSGE